MGSAGLRVIELLKSKMAWAAIGVTVLTLVLIAGVLTVTTTVACGPANGMGVKIAHCSDAKGTSAHLAPNPPTPSYYPAKGNQPPPVYNPPPPYRDPASNYPPYTNPASSDPPKDTSGSRYPPFPNTASGNPPADPFFPPASAGFTPPQTQSCSLPMYAGPPGSGGFVVFPQGNFVADPRSAVALPAPNAGAPSPAPNYPTGGGPGPGYGQGYSGYGMAWDPTHKRWLPVKPEMVAPDGNHYAYPSTNSIYLVDAATNTQVELGAGHPWTVLRVLNDRIYATVPNSPGLGWCLSPGPLVRRADRATGRVLPQTPPTAR
jgi:hypothetical protein